MNKSGLYCIIAFVLVRLSWENSLSRLFSYVLGMLFLIVFSFLHTQRKLVLDFFCSKIITKYKNIQFLWIDFIHGCLIRLVTFHDSLVQIKKCSHNYIFICNRSVFIGYTALNGFLIDSSLAKGFKGLTSIPIALSTYAQIHTMLQKCESLFREKWTIQLHL